MESAQIKLIGDVDIVLDMFVLDWQCQLCSIDGAKSTFWIHATFVYDALQRYIAINTCGFPRQAFCIYCRLTLILSLVAPVR